MIEQIENTLYVLTQGAYLHLSGETAIIEKEGEKLLQVPLHHIGGVVIFGNVMVSPFFLHRCAEEGRSVTLATEYGRFKARLEGPVSGNVLLRQAQYALQDDKARSAALVRSIIAGKIHNTRGLLLRSRREQKDENSERAGRLEKAADRLSAVLRALPDCNEIEVLRGHEGAAAQMSFSVYDDLLRSDDPLFRFDERSRRPPRNRFNALLSFLYMLVTGDCAAALESVGLDPQAGYLHVLRPGRPALALDLAEEFRALMADRLAIALINRHQIDAADFEERTGGAILLAEKGRKTVLAAWQKRKQEEVGHPELARSIPLGLVPMVQARLLARYIRGESETYIPFVPR